MYQPPQSYVEARLAHQHARAYESTLCLPVHPFVSPSSQTHALFRPSRAEGSYAIIG
jgi:hypothetical protein